MFLPSKEFPFIQVANKSSNTYGFNLVFEPTKSHTVCALFLGFLSS